MRLLVVFLLIFVVLGYVGFVRSKHRIRDATHTVVWLENFEDDTVCTAVAVGPHAIITGSHCLVSSFIVVVDWNQPVTVVETLHDCNDHVLLFLSGIKFQTYVKIRTGKPHMGVPVFMWGEAGVFEDLKIQYREGYFSGVAQDWEFGHMDVFVMPVVAGDSGSIIFDVFGRAIGVASAKEGPFTESMPLSFSYQDLRRAEKF